MGIVEDSVIKENRPLLLEMHARVIERTFAFFSRHVTFHERYQEFFQHERRINVLHTIRKAKSRKMISFQKRILQPALKITLMGLIFYIFG